MEYEKDGYKRGHQGINRQRLCSMVDPINNPDISYKIIGSFQEPSGVLSFTGKETTNDAFFKERFGFTK